MVICFLVWQSLRVHKILICEKTRSLSSALGTLSLKWLSNTQVDTSSTSLDMSLTFRGEIRAGHKNWGVSTIKFWEQMGYQVKVQRERKIKFRTVPKGTPIQTLNREDNTGDWEVTNPGGSTILQVQRMVGFRKKEVVDHWMLLRSWESWGKKSLGALIWTVLVE